MEQNLFGSICLTDIPKELITTAANGKKYLTIVVNERREPSRYGHTHYIKAYCKKENQQPDVNYYIGELKPSIISTAAPVSSPFPDYEEPSAEKEDELPF